MNQFTIYGKGFELIKLYKYCLLVSISIQLYIILLFSGDPLYVGFDLTIASFDSISEVSMVSNARNQSSLLKNIATSLLNNFYCNVDVLQTKLCSNIKAELKIPLFHD